ncbi:MAG: ROK family protein [Phycisphaerae bacterium]
MSSASASAIGIDIGGGTIRAGVVDSKGVILHLERARTPEKGAPAELAARISGLYRALLGACPDAPPAAIGIALPGVWDRDTGVMQRAVNLPRLEGVDVVELFARVCERTVRVETDVLAGGWAQWRAGQRSVERFAYLSFGTGVGGCVILNGEFVRHTRGGAGQLGHLIVDTSPHAPRCRCGARGCLEALLNGAAVERARSGGSRRGGRNRRPERRERGTPDAEVVAVRFDVSNPLPADSPPTPHDSPPERVHSAAGPAAREALPHRRGPQRDPPRPIGGRALATLADALAIGLVQIAHLYAPQVVALGGGVIEHEPQLVVAARDAFTRRRGSLAPPEMRIEPAPLGTNEAGVIGVAQLAAGW